MRLSSSILYCSVIIAVAAAGCEMPPEKFEGASGKRTFRQGEYMPRLARWDTGSVAVNRQWFEVFVQTKGVGGRELVGYYQKCRRFKPQPLRAGERQRKNVPIYVHKVFPVSLRKLVGFFTDNGQTYRYVWSDREKKTVHIASTSHENALKLLLGVPTDKALFIKPASRPEEYLWHDWEFKRQ